MSNKKKLLIFIPSFFIAIFLLTYGISTFENRNHKASSNKQGEAKTGEKINIDNSSNSIKIVYESVYLKPEGEQNKTTVDECIEKFNKDKKVISDMTKEQVLAVFKKHDYNLKDIKKDQIVFSRSINKYKYQEGKYVIGIKDGSVAIFKVDKNGNMLLESPKDITTIKVEQLPEGDIELLQKGDKIYEFNTKEEAVEGVEAIFRT
ncbi:hypothetical protein HAHI6034_00695 [Hathewaya histolytica]|uniref:Orf2d n=1 Tax=Hathewaya histolytica TaxID=1498 RepID=Q9ZNJ7_HATHI|nr:hypothetical protein [Hathewaya histolytica]BAA34544.1 unnamed protein product [Hathewaya histolytica]VTQ92540.1 Uncharacterised protein [Hathewaya histolytica]